MGIIGDIIKTKVIGNEARKTLQEFNNSKEDASILAESRKEKARIKSETRKQERDSQKLKIKCPKCKEAYLEKVFGEKREVKKGKASLFANIFTLGMANALASLEEKEIHEFRVITFFCPLCDYERTKKIKIQEQIN